MLTETNSSPGVHSLFARITGAGRTRYLYATELLTVFSSAEPPRLALAGEAGVHPRLDVIGRAGRRIILEDTVDFLNWSPVNTNWLTGEVWSYFDARGISDRRFYRARLQ